MLPKILCAEFFARGYHDQHLKKLCAIHKERRNALEQLILNGKEYQSQTQSVAAVAIKGMLRHNRSKA